MKGKTFPVLNHPSAWSLCESVVTILFKKLNKSISVSKLKMINESVTASNVCGSDCNRSYKLNCVKFS